MNESAFTRALRDHDFEVRSAAAEAFWRVAHRAPTEAEFDLIFAEAERIQRDGCDFPGCEFDPVTHLHRHLESS